MSDLRKLKTTIDGLAGSARQTGGSLGQYRSKFNTQMSQVRAAIGGSSQRKDQEVISALEAADKQVTAAIGALENAAKVAGNYGKSL